MLLSTDAELLIARLSHPLDPDSQVAFRHAAERVLADPGCWGPGSAYRAIAQLWRGFFKPPPDGRAVWDISRRRGANTRVAS